MQKRWQRISVGVSLLILGSFFIFKRPVATLVSSNTFASEPIKVEGLSLQSVENLPTRIIIPDLIINIEIKRAKIFNGFWEIFHASAGWGEGSGMPGNPGNQVIFAHARGGLFLPLKNIKKDMKVYILTKDSWYQYRVSEIKEVFPNQIEVIAPTSDETLTLYTCSGFQDTKRLIVVAKRS